MGIVLYLLYTRRCRTRACRIMRDPHHPINGLFNLLQSGRLLCCHTTRIERLNWASSNRPSGTSMPTPPVPPSIHPNTFSDTDNHKQHYKCLTDIGHCIQSPLHSLLHCIHAVVAYTSCCIFYLFVLYCTSSATPSLLHFTAYLYACDKYNFVNLQPSP